MKKMALGSLIAATALLATAAGVAAAHEGHDHGAAHGPMANAVLKAADGSVKGKAWVEGNQLKVEVAGLPAGVHGTHLHTVGKCDAPDFATAGGHLNPHAKAHGSDNPQGTHLGDLPNLTVGADGKGSLTATLSGSAAELGGALFDADGTAVVVHAGPDDLRTDPSGNSGGRVACGVLTKGG